ncbi:MAG: c-type cytochrome [Acidimicrobiia bacterium]
MTANIITVLAVVAGVAWLGLMVVSALRNRGGEEIAANLQPGIDDQQLETRRLEKSQKVAIVGSAFLAISLPLYFLGEANRQEGFVEEFAHESVERGEHLVEEFACFSCHGPLGVGGSAPFVEKRSGITVSWEAPPLDDVLYRYDTEELNFWITFGRGNTPMPPWGLAGGGPMNEQQVIDIVNYLGTIQISQQEAVDKTPGALVTQVARLQNADQTLETAILTQRQTLAEIEQAPADSVFITQLSEQAREILDNAGVGIDTDDDGLSDFAEVDLSAISSEAVDYFRVVDPIALDPATPDAEKADEAVAQLEAAIPDDPILEVHLAAIEGILETAGEGEDTDGDGISDLAEAAITGQMAEAANKTIPAGIVEIELDPTNPESVGGRPDARTASSMVGAQESVATTTTVIAENQDKLRTTEEGGLEFLLSAQVAKQWEIQIPGVAASMGAGEEDAARAVGLFNANCARCHTSGTSAGVPYTLEAGSGGFGPALWDGRAIVQFGHAPDDPDEPDLLIEFLIKGSEPQKPYGLNGFGSGRMPSFGATLSIDDLDLLARYLRGGNMDGKE